MALDNVQVYIHYIVRRALLVFLEINVLFLFYYYFVLSVGRGIKNVTDKLIRLSSALNSISVFVWENVNFSFETGVD